MLAALSAGRTLVVDRYAYSGAAFTAAKGVPGLDLAWCKVKHLSWHTPAASLYSPSLSHMLGTPPVSPELSSKVPCSFSPHGMACQRCDLQRLAAASGQKGLRVLQAPDSNLPAPDATIFLSMTPEAAAKRGGYGSERYEKVSR